MGFRERKLLEYQEHTHNCVREKQVNGCFVFKMKMVIKEQSILF
ncbi:hypothetical protein Hdeb2414_s0003g00105451 [Helianthus debilis subsp. tardiflorus]